MCPVSVKYDIEMRGKSTQPSNTPIQEKTNGINHFRTLQNGYLLHYLRQKSVHKYACTTFLGQKGKLFF